MLSPMLSGIPEIPDNIPSRRYFTTASRFLDTSVAVYITTAMPRGIFRKSPLAMPVTFLDRHLFFVLGWNHRDIPLGQEEYRVCQKCAGRMRVNDRAGRSGLNRRAGLARLALACDPHPTQS